jgi:hypothetical protein
MATATAAIANHLNIAEAIIVSVEEWAHVLFVRFIGCRPRFVSKKVKAVEMITRSDAAKEIAKAVEGFEKEDYECSVWEKGGRCRIYVKDMGYSNARSQDQGFIHINTDGTIGFDNLKGRPRGVVESVESLTLQIAEDKEGAEAMAKPYSNLPQTKQESWDGYHSQRQAKDYYFGAADEESF